MVIVAKRDDIAYPQVGRRAVAPVPARGVPSTCQGGTQSRSLVLDPVGLRHASMFRGRVAAPLGVCRVPRPLGPLRRLQVWRQTGWQLGMSRGLFVQLDSQQQRRAWFVPTPKSAKGEPQAPVEVNAREYSIMPKIFKDQA